MVKGKNNNNSAQNQLLACLPAEEYRRLHTGLHEITLPPGQVIYDAGSHLNYVYFPTTSVISLIYTMKDGRTSEIARTGNDGVVGVGLFLGGDTTPNRAIVLVPGEALRLCTAVLQEEFIRGSEFQHVLLRYTQTLLTQISQTAACNRLHSVEQRLCRLLLWSYDRLKSDNIRITHESISNMLGGRRESVTVAAGRLQTAGLIRYSRGHSYLLDRDGMEAIVCECYQIIKQESERLQGVGTKVGPNL